MQRDERIRRLEVGARRDDDGIRAAGGWRTRQDQQEERDS
jgi:hypothetical protein